MHRATIKIIRIGIFAPVLCGGSVGLDNVVGVATTYGLDSLRFEFW